MDYNKLDCEIKCAPCFPWHHFAHLKYVSHLFTLTYTEPDHSYTNFQMQVMWLLLFAFKIRFDVKEKEMCYDFKSKYLTQ